MSRASEKLTRPNIYMPQEMVEEIEERARDLKLQRGTYMRDLINMGLEIERDNETRGAL